jgi:hypothetical protein
MAARPTRETSIQADAPESVMPGETISPDIASEQIEGIPLYLIPRAIRDQIQKKREAVARIDVRQGVGHFYTITVTTSERRMLRCRNAQARAEHTKEEEEP